MKKIFIFLFLTVVSCFCSVYGMERRSSAVSLGQQAHLNAMRNILNIANSNEKRATSFVAKGLAGQAQKLLKEDGPYSPALLLDDLLKTYFEGENFNHLVQRLARISKEKDWERQKKRYEELWEWCRNRLAFGQQIATVKSVYKLRLNGKKSSWISSCFCGL